MKIKTSELEGPALDWAVAEASGTPIYRSGKTLTRMDVDGGVYWQPSIYWHQTGPIIERECIEWQWLPSSNEAHRYGARRPSLGGLNRTFCMDGPTILVAAMRCYVASKLGDEVDVPDELVEGVTA